MSRITLNKSTLKNAQEKLALYQQYLPSLELKRQQFLYEVKKAGNNLKRTNKAIDRLHDECAGWHPLLGNMQVEVSGLLSVERVDLAQENVLGVHLPVVKEVVFSRRPYSYLATPQWVDTVNDALADMARLHLERQVQEQRAAKLEKALRVTTQRLNLFEYILIPAARETIRKINIYLSDAEIAGVARAKIAKALRLKKRV